MTTATDVTGTDRAENIRMIRESARFATQAGRMEEVRRLRYSLPGIDRAAWMKTAQLGWLGLRLPETRGGAGFGMAEFCALAEELGRGLMPEALIGAIAIAPLLPDHCLAAVLDGSRIVLPALHEVLGDPGRMEARLENGRVTGTKRYVPMAASADSFMVATRDGLALVDRDSPGLGLKTDLLQDGGHFGTLELTGVMSSLVDTTPTAAREEIILGLAAYLLGVGTRTFEIAREYLLTREQFGRPIGNFQALQHRMVDLYLQIELASATIARSAHLFDGEPSASERSIAASRAKSRASDMAMLVTREAVQFHGAMGYTDECDVGLYLRKAMVLATASGSSAWHRRRFALLADPARNRIAA